MKILSKQLEKTQNTLPNLMHNQHPLPPPMPLPNLTNPLPRLYVNCLQRVVTSSNTDFVPQGVHVHLFRLVSVQVSLD
jgi:hypothetical protein